MTGPAAAQQGMPGCWRSLSVNIECGSSAGRFHLLSRLGHSAHLHGMPTAHFARETLTADDLRRRAPLARGHRASKTAPDVTKVAEEQDEGQGGILSIRLLAPVAYMMLACLSMVLNKVRMPKLNTRVSLPTVAPFQTFKAIAFCENA